MKNICRICATEPNSHSFSKTCEIDGVGMYYSKPASATKYNDEKGILQHFDNLLQANNESKWIWVIDGSDFEMKHALEVGIIKNMLKVIENKYLHSLVEIQVKNMNGALEYLYGIISPFINNELSSKIRFIARSQRNKRK